MTLEKPAAPTEPHHLRYPSVDRNLAMRDRYKAAGLERKEYWGLPAEHERAAKNFKEVEIVKKAFKNRQ